MSAPKTRLHLQLSADQCKIIRNWISFVDNRVDADYIVLDKITIPEGFCLLDDKDCEIINRWWNYLPNSMIDDSDKELFDHIQTFLYR